MYKKNKRTRKKRAKYSITYRLKSKSASRIVLLFAVIMWFQLICTIQVSANNEAASNKSYDEIQEDIIIDQLQSPEIKVLKDYFNQLAIGNSEQLLGRYNADDIMKDAIKGNLKLNIIGIFKKAANYFVQEIYLNIHILLKLIALIIICAILNNFQNSFIKDGVGELAFFVCYIILVSVLVIGFKEAVSFGINVIEQMAGFMYASIPVMIALLVSSGSVTSGSIFKPILFMVVETTATIIKNIFVPLVFLSTALSIVNNTSDRLHLDKLAGLIKKIGLVFIGIMMTTFIGVLTIQGPVSAVADGVTNKTIKFALGTFIPIVGGYLADAADTMIGCTLLIKNAAGIVVMIGVISICIIPILKMSAVIMLYKITCAITEPISEKRVTNSINDVANSIALMLGAVAVVTLMFVISITVIIAAGNMTAMIR